MKKTIICLFGFFALGTGAWAQEKTNAGETKNTGERQRNPGHTATTEEVVNGNGKNPAERQRNPAKKETPAKKEETGERVKNPDQ